MNTNKDTSLVFIGQIIVKLRAIRGSSLLKFPDYLLLVPVLPNQWHLLTRHCGRKNFLETLAIQQQGSSWWGKAAITSDHPKRGYHY
jgi:hypothetical protein